MKAVEEENVDAIETVIDENYWDSFHNNKEHLLSHCRQTLTQHIVENNKIKKTIITISGDTATATIFITTKLDANSYVVKNYGISSIPSEADINFIKQSDNTWLINRIEIRRLNYQQANWGQIR
jgi:hypothetical protein